MKEERQRIFRMDNTSYFLLGYIIKSCSSSLCKLNRGGYKRRGGLSLQLVQIQLGLK